MNKWWISDILWHYPRTRRWIRRSVSFQHITCSLKPATRIPKNLCPLLWTIWIRSLAMFSGLRVHLTSVHQWLWHALPRSLCWSSPIPPQYHFRQSMQYWWSWCLHMLTRDHREMDMTCQHFNIALHDLIFRHNIRGLKSQLLVLSDHGWSWT